MTTAKLKRKVIEGFYCTKDSERFGMDLPEMTTDELDERGITEMLGDYINPQTGKIIASVDFIRFRFMPHFIYKMDSFICL